LQENTKHIRKSTLTYLSSLGVNPAPTFVRAATFGQLTKHIFDHGGGESKLQKSLPPWHLSFRSLTKTVHRYPAIQQQRAHRAIAAHNPRLKFFEQIHLPAGLTVRQRFRSTHRCKKWRSRHRPSWR